MIKKLSMPTANTALPGRSETMPISGIHYVNGHPMKPPFENTLQLAQFGMGCFWGAEKCFWEIDGVYSTAAGYSGGFTPNPVYEEVCSGLTGHNETVLVVFDPQIISYQDLLIRFWESHNPTQGMRQGNDQGTQYRSGIYTYSDRQMQQAIDSMTVYQNNLSASGLGKITTEIKPATEFYYGEEFHQQYLAKNPQGYCGLGGTGVLYKSN